MRNRYGGKCYRCGEWVEPGAGFFEKVPGKGFRVQHVECCEKARTEREEKDPAHDKQ